MIRRKICYITGTRADYELMSSTLKAIRKDPKLNLFLIVTGMHLDDKRGMTINNIPSYDKIWRNTKDLRTLMRILRMEKPDILLVEGDRLEALLTSIAGVFLNIPVFHVSGGSISGSVDDSFRHAITKLAHVHLPPIVSCAERILHLGEEGWRVKIVGHPINKRVVSKKVLEKELGLKVDKSTLLVLQHPVVQEKRMSTDQMRETLEAVVELKKQCVVILPNDDPGSEGMIRVIKAFDRAYPFIHVYENLRGEIFTTLMKFVGVIIGNSSAGLVEAPRYNLPCVNIGSRQSGRERAGNVIDSSHDRRNIKAGIKYAISKKFRDEMKKKSNPYKSEGVEKNIVKVLKSTELGMKLLNKKITY